MRCSLNWFSFGVERPSWAWIRTAFVGAPPLLDRHYSWREKLLEGGALALNGKDERQAEKELKKKIAELERALGRKTYELEIAGEALRAWE